MFSHDDLSDENWMSNETLAFLDDSVDPVIEDEVLLTDPELFDLEKGGVGFWLQVSSELEQRYIGLKYEGADPDLLSYFYAHLTKALAGLFWAKYRMYREEHKDNEE